jgi:hypothetical protein
MRAPWFDPYKNVKVVEGRLPVRCYDPIMLLRSHACRVIRCACGKYEVRR